MLEDTLRLLLVEDSSSDAVLIQHILREGLADAALSIEHVRSIKEAWDRLQRQPFDALLVDYWLGLDDGISLLREARSSGIETPAILLTGMEDAQVEVRALRAGAADYVRKADM